MVSSVNNGFITCVQNCQQIKIYCWQNKEVNQKLHLTMCPVFKLSNSVLITLGYSINMSYLLSIMLNTFQFQFTAESWSIISENEKRLRGYQTNILNKEKCNYNEC